MANKTDFMKYKSVSFSYPVAPPLTNIKYVIRENCAILLKLA